VTGRSGRYGDGHAWVQFSKDGRDFLVEPLMARVGSTMPRLSTLRYRPRYSVAWDGTNLSFFLHEDRRREPTLLKLIALTPDWLIFWAYIWTMVFLHLPAYLCRRVSSIFRPQGHSPK
jgi:hypothetical protein